jgi:hypothetical protein
MLTRHKDALQEILLYYGSLHTCAALLNMQKESCKTDFANNTEAVIHRHTAILDRAVNEMADSHPMGRATVMLVNDGTFDRKLNK